MTRQLRTNPDGMFVTAWLSLRRTRILTSAVYSREIKVLEERQFSYYQLDMC